MGFFGAELLHWNSHFSHEERRVATFGPVISDHAESESMILAKTKLFWHQSDFFLFLVDPNVPDPGSRRKILNLGSNLSEHLQVRR